MADDVQPQASTIDEVAASIQRKLGGGDEKPRDDRGRFVSQATESDAQTESPTSDTGEPDEGEADQGDLPEDGEQAAEGTAETPQTYTVKVNGQDESVTLENLIASYSKDADYRQKTEALRRDRESWEGTREQSLKAERDQLQAAREEAQKVLTGWQQFVEAQFGNKEYWDNLERTDPGRYAAEQVKLHRQLQEIQSQSAKMQKEQDDKKTSESKAHQAAEFRKLVDAVPEWKDTAKLNEGYQKVAKYAVEVRGFKPEDLGAFVNNHRLLLAFKDAEAFHALSQKKPEIAPKAKVIQPARPGPAQPPNSKAKASQKTYERFRETGRTEDLAAHFRNKFGLG